MGILENLASSKQLKQLNNKQLESLSAEIRENIVKTISNNGGHLSSNLGIVETTIALYKTFDFPNDKLIFDVGHQCYAHKILSDRKDKFSTIRLNDGISGFPNKDESEFDPFTLGHAGTSISLGLGYCMARDKLNEDYTVVSVVGDGSFSNGLNLEALFSSSEKPKNFVVILNDNGMSISKNRNAFYRFITKSSMKNGYLGSKKAFKKVFKRSFVTRFFGRIKDSIKRTFNKNDYFEDYGFKYVGVVDGNNVKEMVNVLESVKRVAKEKAVLLHVVTTKGKGYKEAEMHADTYHGVGSNLVVDSGTFSTALGEGLNELINKDNRIMAITAGMKDGTGLSQVEKANPDNFIDVGIAEEYAVTLASGMAKGGLRPFVCIYSTFLQRAYDQIIHDVCLQNLPVIFCVDRAGLVGSDGETHQGVFDLSFLLHMPNMTVLAPNTNEELLDAMNYALKLNSPVAIRYPKNQGGSEQLYSLEQGLYRKVKVGTKANVLAVGPNMLSIAKQCAEQIDGLGVISVRCVKPLDLNMLDSIKELPIITLEENSEIGGFGAFVSAYLNNKKQNVKVLSLGVCDSFIKHGSIDKQLVLAGLGSEEIKEKITSFLN